MASASWGLNVERNFFGQMCGDTRLVMVDVIVGQEHHVHASDNILNRMVRCTLGVLFTPRADIKVPLSAKTGSISMVCPAYLIFKVALRTNCTVDVFFMTICLVIDYGCKVRKNPAKHLCLKKR